ncbi:DUF2934 domain-containing protein [Bradyrhizobium sp. C-145]|nr:DUF2934 domain-containing protein [Bradyrhizobium sp. C-145]UQR68029.1 DUF2934 domain-containing protein [Bradyrhizobium sp. C-145]
MRTYGHQLWEKTGRPEGRDKEFWELANKSCGIRTNLLRCAPPITSDEQELPNLLRASAGFVKTIRS